ncbi:retrovirus-related pol polyprotein from transposon TNT 1-94, partial [Tanacetum coccineum]
GTCPILLTLNKLMEDILPLEVTPKEGKSKAELTDESHVLLKVPRKNNMYSVDLKNIVPKGGLTCLFAKATSDESKLWHRRLGHINFKTMNKLVKGNLVRGLPSKLFENNPKNPVLLSKGKQHRASCIVQKHDSKLPTTFWAEAVNTACYVQNRVLVTKPHNKTPYELFLARKQALGFMRPFGYLITILNTIDHLGKFDDKTDEGFFVGYSIKSKAFRVFNSRTRIVEENLHVQLSENTPNIVGSGANWLFDINALTKSMNYKPIVAGNQSNGNAGTKACHDTGKARMETIPGMIYIRYLYGTADPPFLQINAVSGKTSIELLDYPNMPELEDIVYSDYDEDVGAEADMNNLDAFMSVSPIPTTRTLVELPNGKRAIGTKWVFRNKKDERGIVIKNKARLVAQGYTQEEGIDYDEVFAPVARIEATRLFLAYASFKDFVLYQIDVKSDFLYGKIEVQVYVCQPLGFEDPDFPDKVYKVEKALYGLHQALRAWYETLSTYLLDNGFQRGKIDKTLFIKRDKGLQVKQKEDGIFINQDKYVTKILKKFGFTNFKTASTPIETQKPLLKDEDGEEVDVHFYRSMIGSLMYLTSSRHNIMFAMCACARYQVNPKVSHLHAVKRIFRNLKGQPKLGLWYLKDSPFDLVAYINSDYAGASLDKKSITGGCQFLRCRLISWQCKKQTVVANSITEAEYVAASSCCGQVL